MENKYTDIFWENEINSNRLLAAAMLGAAALYALVCFFVDFGVFYIYRWNGVAIRLIMLLVEISLLSGFFVSRHYNYEKKWLKTVLMWDYILAFAFFNMVFTYTTSILMVLPIILSSRYFSKEYTLKISFETILTFAAATFLGALYGNYDINNLQLPPHTVIDMGNEMWISDLIDAGGLDFDRWLMVRNVFLYAYFPNLLMTILCVLICLTISIHGREMVLQQKELAENSARVETELDLAAKIQRDMIPSTFPVFIDREEFELYASMTPAKEVGGDFYDFFLVDDDHLGLVIADVSGKGVPAAMFMMLSKNIIANNVMLGKSPAEALHDANESICANNSENMFVTVWLGVLEIRTGKLTAVSAGHEYPILRQNGGRFEIFKDKHGLAVGAFEGVNYMEYEVQLKPGDRVFVYTDGVPEATDANNELFGMDRALEALNRNTEASPEEMLKNVREGVDEFVKDAEQFDDLTMLALEYKGVS